MKQLQQCRPQQEMLCFWIKKQSRFFSSNNRFLQVLKQPTMKAREKKQIKLKP